MQSCNLSQKWLSLMAQPGLCGFKDPFALHPFGYTNDAGLAYSIWWLEQ